MPHTVTDADLAAYFALPLDWNTPATQEELTAAGAVLEMSWLPELRALYERHDGASGLATDWEDQWTERVEADEDIWPAMPRLMSLKDVQNFYTDTYDFLIPEVRFFWTDDNSNYVGVYVGEIMTGAVCFYNHDEPAEVSPIFQTVADFLAWAVAHPEEDLSYSDLTPSIYPLLIDDAQQSAEDWRHAQALYAKVADHEDGASQMLAVAMNITPPAQSQALLPYLETPDFYVAARAVNILGARRYQPARAGIERLALHGVSNAQSAAQRVLKFWNP